MKDIYMFCIRNKYVNYDHVKDITYYKLVDGKFIETNNIKTSNTEKELAR